jgi:cystinosin
VWQSNAGTIFFQIYIFSYIKLVITVVKYVPQAWMNYKRQSTLGWNINQILLDLTGGVLSLVQLIMDSSLQSDWSGITGNPVKLFLGNITIISDLIFITQHYILYRGAESKPGDPHSDADSTAPLLAEESTQAR